MTVGRAGAQPVPGLVLAYWCVGYVFRLWGCSFLGLVAAHWWMRLVLRLEQAHWWARLGILGQVLPIVCGAASRGLWL